MEDVRVAVAEDVPRVVQLLNQAITQTPNERAGHLSGFPRRHVAAEQRIATALASPTHIVFVGLLETYVVGLALVSLDDSMPGGQLAIVEELYVEPQAREVGIGEAMLDTAVQWAREKQCAGIEVEALPGARSAKNLAERSGFVARVLVMYRGLQTP